MAELAEKYAAEFLSDTVRSAIVKSVIEVPESLRGRPCAVGIDEAGRGPVLGPMVYSAFACCIDQVDSLKAAHVADSKTLNEAQREEIFESLCDLRSSTIWYAKLLSPAFISSSMLSRSKYNLNEISQDTAALLLRMLIDSGVNVRRVFIDTVGDPNKYRARISSQFSESIEFTVCPKADSLYPEVSAASICAKVLRDCCIKRWQLADGLIEETEDGTKYGSGYPGDPNTKAFLRTVFDPVFGFPGLVRFSWSTAAQMMLKDGARVRWCDDEDENGNNAPSRQSQWRKRPAQAADAEAEAQNDDNPPKRASATTRKQKPIATGNEVGSLMKFFGSKTAENGSKADVKLQKAEEANQTDDNKEADKAGNYKLPPSLFKFTSLKFSTAI